jgi:hypothetical protein
MKCQYILDSGLIALARLGDELVGHAIAVVRKDHDQFEGIYS